jgi:putative hydrolase of the HAD superfamily
MNRIKNYILDFGGVFYKIDPKRTVEKFIAHSENPEILSSMSLGQIALHPVFLEYEKGLISTEVFREKAKKAFGIKDISAIQFDEYWNATLLGYKPNVIDFLYSLKNLGSIALLSNTNSLHYNYFYNELNEFFNLLDYQFLSFNMKMRKPEPEIYRTVLAHTGFNPENTLFIDDTEVNIKAAADLGLNSMLVDCNINMSDLLHSVNNYSQ